MTEQVADGVHRLELAHTNLYLVVTEGRMLIIDAGLPGMWKPLRAALDALGVDHDQLDGVVLTHGHFDHVGLLNRMHRDWSVPVWVHPGDARLVRHPYRYRPEQNRVLFPLLHPAGWAPLARLVAAGALTVRGAGFATELDPSAAPEALDRHGIKIIPTPGHTTGHVALHLPERDVVITGDALVTFDPYTGRSGAQIIAPAATADSVENLASLERIADTGAGTALPGHGGPWTSGVAEAVRQARRAR